MLENRMVMDCEWEPIERDFGSDYEAPDCDGDVTDADIERAKKNGKYWFHPANE